MTFDWQEWVNLVFRWVHLVAGIAWIGHLYFFNFVNAHVAKTYSADAKKSVVPELMPRALYWFRHGAAFTWVTGAVLLALIYYHGGLLLTGGPMTGGSIGVGVAISLGSLVVSFGLYDVLFKQVKNEKVGIAIAYVLLVALMFGLSRYFSPRAVWIHLGGIFGTLMAANVWMRIWPNQRKIIAAIKGGTAPDAALVGLAGLRSRHNTYMSVPLMLSMLSAHFPTLYATPDHAWITVAVMVLIGWAATKFLFVKSASAAPSQF